MHKILYGFLVVFLSIKSCAFIFLVSIRQSLVCSRDPVGVEIGWKWKVLQPEQS